MPGLTVREFECDLCRRPFTLLAADLMLPQPNVCDGCLRYVWDLDDKVLAEHVAECLARDVPQAGEHPKSQGEEHAPANGVVQDIK